MNSVMENKHEVVEMGETEGDGGADVIDVLRRFHYGEPAAAAHTTNLRKQSCLLCSIPTGMRQPFATSTRCTWYRPMERSIRYSRRP